jgi:DNA-binding LytR/AlgR family response regulator
MKCIAIDDEPLALRLLQDNISKVPYLELIAACRNAFDALKVLEEQHVDLIFIDIQMPGLTGLQFVSTLQTRPLVIFITAYKEFALEGYNLAVVDYLVKPVALDRFIIACNRAKELYELKLNKYAAVVKAEADYFFVNVDYSQLKIKFSDIIWIEGVRDYIKIHLTGNAQPVLVRSNLKSMEEQLPLKLFIRIHKSFMVAISSITAVRKSNVFLDNLELPIGETYKDAVEQLVKQTR